MFRQKRKKAFTLVELVLYIVMLTAVIASTPHAALLCRLAYSSVMDEQSAHKRAGKVLAIIGPPLEMCGYGLPKEPTEYRAAFGSVSIAPFNWSGPISVTDSTIELFVNKKASNCRIAYGVPTGNYVTSCDEIRSASFGLKTDGLPHLLEAGKSKSYEVKNWIIAGAATPRFSPAWLASAHAASGGGYTLNLRRTDTGDAVRFASNDELHYLRVMECRTRPYDGMAKKDFAFYTNDHMGSEWQPRVLGVVDARFEVDSDRGLARIWLLVRGNTRYSGVKSPGTPAGWPEEYAKDIPREMRNYRLYAYTRSFRLKNF